MAAFQSARYEAPDSLEAALECLSSGAFRILAGGTDLYPATSSQSLSGAILDITRISELKGLFEEADHWRIGAAVTWSDIIAASQLPPAFDALKLAAREVGSLQIQNRATLAGNICNASPAADGVPALMILDCQVELSSKQGTRRVPLEDFILGNRRTARRPDELVCAFLLPKPSLAGQSHFLKLGARKYLVISIAMVAVRLSVEAGVIASAALAVGSCSEVARRLSSLERALVGLPADPFSISSQVARAAQDAVERDLAPIDDVRGTASYRKQAASEIVLRAVSAALPSPSGMEAAL